MPTSWVAQVLLFALMLVPTARLCASPAPAKGQGTTDGTTRSPHGPLALPCQNCHTSVAWKPIRAIPEFDHNKTRYPLRGMHQNVACVQCHTKPVFTNVGIRCAECHADIHRGQFGAACDQCHTVKGWDVSIQSVKNHDNRFPLVGAHSSLDCEACHKGAAVGQFVGLSTQCYSCHAQVYQRATNPNHVALRFSTSCDACHGVDTWFNARFDHNATGFPLTGAHATLQCQQCHVNNNFNITNTACVSCHLNDFQKTTNPSHVALNFSQNCQQCHTTVAWNPATFDHNSVGFPLTNGHAGLQCAQCHSSNNYNIASGACYQAGCHINDYTNAVSPVNHVQLGFPTACQQCHDTVNWMNGKFDHSQPPASWALTGAHAMLQCNQCHTNNNYNLSVTTCVSCHLKDFQATNNPNHVQQGFSQSCETCHNTSAWNPAQFDHSKSGFPLVGAHATTPCASCHINNNYNLTSGTCYQAGCHINDYNNAVSPINHIQLGFPTTCQNCHDTVAWTDGKFDHSQPPANWALTGTHATTPCASCHVNNNYNLTSTTCYQAGCHINDYNNAVSPVNHIQLGFPTTCQNCHDTVAWTDGKFDHSQPPANWALTGTHATTPCASCHTNNNYNLTSTTCYQAGCHINDYNNAVSPVNHVQLGIPTTCQTCHDTVAWTDGKFDHSQPPANWALTGVHATTPCSSCHTTANGGYNITSTACALCHMTDYNNAVTPVNHKASGFPTTCEGCHDTVNWMDGKFNHATTGFTLIGTHATLQCNQCHGTSNYSFTSGTCYQAGCHITDYQNAVSPINHIQLGFPTTCETCHADEVAWTNGKFDHSGPPANWALQGVHATTPCASCHVNNNYALASTDCYTCHKADYSAVTSPTHVAPYFPTTCTTCHTTWVTTNWLGATFPHSQYTAFPTNHGGANNVCSTCHISAGNYAIFQCTNCHGGNNAANFHHPSVSGYVYNSVNCYQCHASGNGG